MLLTNLQILAYAKSTKLASFDVSDSFKWLAASCARQLTGDFHKMKDFYQFTSGSHYTHVEGSYGRLCEQMEDARPLGADVSTPTTKLITELERLVALKPITT